MQSDNLILEIYRYNYDFKDKLLQILQKTFKEISKPRIEEIISSSKNDKEILDQLLGLSKNSKLKKQTVFEKASFSSTRAQWRIGDIQKSIDLKKLQIKTYLDIGSGEASIAYHIGKFLELEPCNVFASDIYKNPEMPKDLNFILIKENINFLFESGSIDLITFFQSIHHIKDLEFRMEDISRILRDGGHILLREHNVGSLEMEKLIFIEHMVYEMFFDDTSYENFKETYYGKYFSKSSLEIFLKKFNFSLVKTFGLNSNKNPTNYYYALYRADAGPYPRVGALPQTPEEGGGARRW